MTTVHLKFKFLFSQTLYGQCHGTRFSSGSDESFSQVVFVLYSQISCQLPAPLALTGWHNQSGQVSSRLKQIISNKQILGVWCFLKILCLTVQTWAGSSISGKHVSLLLLINVVGVYNVQYSTVYPRFLGYQGLCVSVCTVLLRLYGPNIFHTVTLASLLHLIWGQKEVPIR